MKPLINRIKKNFQQFGVFHVNLSIDESMIEYYGKHPAKQFIHGKPYRFGYKNWMMATPMGIVMTLIYIVAKMKIHPEVLHLEPRSSLIFWWELKIL
jgi:hypothetical protein